MNVLVAAVVLSAGQASADVDLVYGARYYFQGKKKSYQQIYMVRHDGKHRFQVTDSRFDTWAPVWVDRSHIAYAEQYAHVPSKVPGVEGQSRYRIILYDLRSGKKKLLKDVGLHSDFQGCWSRGSNIVFQDYVGTYNTKDVTYAVGLRAAKVVPNDDNGEAINGPPRFEESGRSRVFTRSGSSTHFTWDAKDAANEGEVTLCLQAQRNKSSKTYNLRGTWVENAFQCKDGTYIFVLRSAWDKYRCDHFVYRISSDLKSSRLLTKDIGVIDLKPSTPLWQACQPDLREGAMEDLNDGRSVYVSWLFTGNWQTGEQWTIAKGLVYVGDSAFRPRK